MWYNRVMRNDVQLCWEFEGAVLASHFKLREFESKSGLVVLDSSVVRCLELVRRDLSRFYHLDVQIMITSGTRTQEDNDALGARLGWVEDGGAVAHDSMHLPQHGGIAVDVYARYGSTDGYTVVPQDNLASACRLYFTFVKGDYGDGHVHADNRETWRTT